MARNLLDINITEALSLLSKSLGGTRFKIHKKEPNQFGESNIKMIISPHIMNGEMKYIGESQNNNLLPKLN